MKVSVVITCYNLGEYVEEAVNSVLNQTLQDFEIIIVNDGSTDEKTNELLKNFSKPKTRVITTTNQGLPSARNNGVKEAKGTYIVCLDADDKFEPKYLEECVAVFESDKKNKLGFITAWIKTFGDREEIWYSSDYNPINLMSQTHYGVAVASMFKRSVWKEVGGYPTNLSKGGYEDLSFWISIVALGYEWHCIHEPLFRYRLRQGSMITDARARHVELLSKVIDNNLEYYQKNVKELVLHFSQNYMELDKKYHALLAETNSKKSIPKKLRNLAKKVLQ